MLGKLCEEIVKSLHASRNAYLDKIVSGKVEDFAAYKYYAGILEGQKQAEEIIRTTYDLFMEPRKMLKAKMGE